MKGPTPKSSTVGKLHALVTGRPKLIFAIVALMTFGLGALILRVHIDTDPENMLPKNEKQRVFHNQVKKRFDIPDAIVVGVVNEKHPDGVFNPDTLGRLHKLARGIQGIKGVIARDLISPSTVDSIRPLKRGTVKFEWLLSGKPESRAAALAVRKHALRLPVLRGTVVSDDGRAVAMLVPIKHKDQGHRIAGEIKALIEKLGGDETYHFTGLPVAEDTFGYEMFKQMAISAPLAALVIFVVMWWFFRSVALITSPMILAMATVISTMGLMIGLGFTVHIMSSMIPIFLMPIAVVDSVHILSEFADRYRPGDDVKDVVGGVMSSLFKPMLFTSLTSAAGFISLAFTPIPPVQIFGVFVAFGILLAYALTIVFIPAYIVSLSPKRLAKLAGQAQSDKGYSREENGLLARVLRHGGKRAIAMSKPAIAVAVLLAGVSAYGISKIEINDNPVRWFKSSHPIRVADRVLNAHFAGTYPAFLVLDAGKVDKAKAALKADVANALAKAKAGGVDLDKQWAALSAKAAKSSKGKGLTERLRATLDGIENVLDKLEDGDDDDTAAKKIAAWKTVRTAIERAQSAVAIFRSPKVLRWVEKLNAHLSASPLVGKTVSIIDVIKTVRRELFEGNKQYFAIPDSDRAVEQTLITFQSSHQPHFLWHFVTPSYRAMNIWLQLKSGDNRDMVSVVERLKAYVAKNPAPAGIKLRWAGLTYLNVVWQDRMVSGMTSSLLGAFVVVFVMMVLLFRSLTWGLLAMVPLSLTIGLIYGIIGLIGKDYDMPVAVLSSLTLGLSVDFAIHFLERARALHRELGSFTAVIHEMFEEPGRAIARNAFVIAIGFLPLLAAPLVPYNTVGIFMASIMAVSSVVTVVLLPSILSVLRRQMLPEVGPKENK